MNETTINAKLDRIEKKVAFSKKVLTFDEACDYTGFSKSYMYKLTSFGIIPHSKPNGKIIFFDKELLDNWLLSNSSKSVDQVEKEANDFTLKKKA